MPPLTVCRGTQAAGGLLPALDVPERLLATDETGRGVTLLLDRHGEMVQCEYPPHPHTHTLRQTQTCSDPFTRRREFGVWFCNCRMSLHTLYVGA